jgi:hypothetical protein
MKRLPPPRGLTAALVGLGWRRVFEKDSVYNRFSGDRRLEEGHFSLSESATTFIQGGEVEAKASQIEVTPKGTDCR